MKFIIERPQMATYGYHWRIENPATNGRVVARDGTRLRGFESEKEARQDIAAARKAFQGARMARVVVDGE